MDIPTSVDVASKKDIVYLLLVAVVALFGLLVVVGKLGLVFFKNALDRSQVDREKYHENLTTLVSNQNETTKEVTRVLTENTGVIRETRQAMEQCNTELRMCRDKRSYPQGT